jgi:hypothetical protein
LDVDLEAEMKKDAIVAAYLKDVEIAKDFYRALCNMRWKKKDWLTPHDMTVARLKGDEPGVWSCSWRYAGGIIADIRNLHYNTTEDYMDFYCSGSESDISDIVKECFNRMGWIPYPWPPEDGI